MFSIIICSISPERLSRLKENIEETIGVEHEIIAFDNRELKWPIAKVYNEGARRARHPYLFFVHEDVRFHTLGWGEVIAGKLKEPDCGVIGFAGSKIKLKTYTGWGTKGEYSHVLMYQGGLGKTLLMVSHIYPDEPFSEVITLDGLGMFVAKAVWEQYPFDEKMLTGFHCYDLDFSLQIATSSRYKNYVCCTPKVLIEHFSAGCYNKTWFEDTIRLHREKWQAFLPIWTSDVHPNPKELKRLEEKWFHKFMRKLLRYETSYRKQLLREFLAYPFSWKHLGHCIKCLYRYYFKRPTQPTTPNVCPK